MKKLAVVFGLIFVLGSFTSASAMDQTGKFAIGGHFGYSFGFGDVFDEYEWAGQWGTEYVVVKYQNKVTYSFLGNVKFWVSPTWALLGAVDYQAGEVDVTGSIADLSTGISESYDWTSVIGNVVYTIPTQTWTCPYLTAGGGIYFNDDISEPGINLGGGIEHFFQDNLALDVGTRYHMIFTEEERTNYLNLYAGLNYYFGVK
ncbi:MAG: outer membrane beta-barrel protein [candidate division Zixibacteria bacterium]|nr:outer membrane beta-barrel protein [candidate division Zixibacteria bacterium]